MFSSLRISSRYLLVVAIGISACAVEAPPEERVGLVQQADRPNNGTSAQGKTAQGLASRGISPGRLKVMTSGATWERDGVRYDIEAFRIENGHLAGTLRKPGGLRDGQPLPDDGVGTTFIVRSVPVAYFPEPMYPPEEPVVSMTVKVESKVMDTNESNLMSSCAHRTNDVDVHLYALKELVADTGEWVDFCTPHPGKRDDARAIFNRGYWQRTEYETPAWPIASYVVNDSSAFGLSCWDGVATKCARWGYKEWQTLVSPRTGKPVPMQNAYIACQRAAMSDYCGDGMPNTLENTDVDLWDAHGFIEKHAEDESWPMYADESSFDATSAVRLESERYGEMPAHCATCPGQGEEEAATCRPRIGESFYVERDTYTGVREQLVFVDSGAASSCPHEVTTYFDPPRRMKPTCNTCTRKICSDPAFAPLQCCSAWTKACAEAAERHCAMKSAVDRPCAVTPAP